MSDGWLNQHIFKVTPKTEIIDKGFFFYLMKFLKPYFKKIATNKQTTGLGHVIISDLQRMSVTLPPPSPHPAKNRRHPLIPRRQNRTEQQNKHQPRTASPSPLQTLICRLRTIRRQNARGVESWKIVELDNCKIW